MVVGGGYIEDQIRKPLFDTDVALLPNDLNPLQAAAKNTTDDQPYLP